MSDTLLTVSDIRTWFHNEQGVARVVDGVPFELRPGVTFGNVGEYGRAKSVNSLINVRLHPEPQ